VEIEVSKKNQEKKTKKMTFPRALWCVLSIAAVVLWGCVIFRFSAQNATESSGLSGRVSYAIADELTQFRGEEVTETERQTLALKIEHPLRKCAHMSEYAVFALLLFNLLCAVGIKGKKRFPIVLLIVFLYAGTDEFHQLFVSGRSGQFTDVLIDTAGGLLMLFVVWLVLCIHGMRKK
jgi:VanZ family protein